MTIPVTELDMARIEQLLDRARTEPLSEADCQLIRAIVDTLFYLSDLAENHRTTLAQLRALLARTRRRHLHELHLHLPAY